MEFDAQFPAAIGLLKAPRRKLLVILFAVVLAERRADFEIAVLHRIHQRFSQGHADTGAVRFVDDRTSRHRPL